LINTHWRADNMEDISSMFIDSQRMVKEIVQNLQAGMDLFMAEHLDGLMRRHLRSRKGRRTQ